MSRRRVKKWFKPKRGLYGWAADKSQLARRQALGRRAKVTGWLSVGRALVALANITRDSWTRRVARVDSRYAFERHRAAKLRACRRLKRRKRRSVRC
jgi:hypothetical protein